MFSLAVVLGTVVQMVVVLAISAHRGPRGARPRRAVAAESLAAEIAAQDAAPTPALDSLFAHRRVRLGGGPAWIA